MKIRRKLRNINYYLDRKLWRKKQKIRKVIRRRIKGQYTAGEILNLTFKKIKKRYGEQEIIFPSYTLSLIADDSDYHRTRQGFMRYDSVVLIISLGDKFWALGKGRAWGGYPADPYNNDILVLELENSLKNESDQKIAENIMERINRYCNRRFRNSIIAARKSGHLFIGKRWQEVMTALVSPKISDFIEKGLETHKGYVVPEIGGIVPAVKSSVKYKKQFANFLSQTIMQVLNDISKYK